MQNIRLAPLELKNSRFYKRVSKFSVELLHNSKGYGLALDMEFHELLILLDGFLHVIVMYVPIYMGLQGFPWQQLLRQ